MVGGNLTLAELLASLPEGAKVVAVTIPSHFNLRLNDGRVVVMEKGTAFVPDYVADHWYSKDQGVKAAESAEPEPEVEVTEDHLKFIQEVKGYPLKSVDELKRFLVSLRPEAVKEFFKEFNESMKPKLPSAEDLDAVAAEQAAKDATAARPGRVTLNPQQ